MFKSKLKPTFRLEKCFDWPSIVETDNVQYTCTRQTPIQFYSCKRSIRLIDWLIYPLECFFGSECHDALDRNPGPGYNTLLLRLITGDRLGACSHGQFDTLPGLLDSRAALSNSFPYACVHFTKAVCTIFMFLVWSGRGANPRYIAREADTQTTQQIRILHGQYWIHHVFHETIVWRPHE